MNSWNPNATPAGPGDEAASPHSSLTRLLSPIRAEVRSAPDGATLRLEPMSVTDAIAVLAELAPSDAAEILVARGGDDPTSTRPASTDPGRSPDRAARADSAASSREVPPIDPHPTYVEAVLVDGPIEPRDAEAIALRPAGRTALAVELRAVASVSVTRNRTIVAELREPGDATLFIAEALRRYVAALRGAAPAEIARPELRLVERMLDRSGHLEIRPLETDVYSTAIDVGILTSPTGTGPADASLVYDLFSNSWHGD